MFSSLHDGLVTLIKGGERAGAVQPVSSAAAGNGGIDWDAEADAYRKKPATLPRSGAATALPVNALSPPPPPPPPLPQSIPRLNSSPLAPVMAELRATYSPYPSARRRASDNDADDDTLDGATDQAAAASDWTTLFDPKSGARLYHQITTGITQWARPANVPEIDGEDINITTAVNDRSPRKSIDRGVVGLPLEELTAVPLPRVLATLESMRNTMEILLNRGSGLDDAAVADLTSVSRMLDGLTERMAATVSIIDENDADTLIEYHKLPWTFTKSTAVEYYRAAALTAYQQRVATQGDGTYAHWSTPMFLSTALLPPQINTYPVHIALPNNAEGLRLSIGPVDTAASVIRLAMAQLTDRRRSGGESENSWVLKSVGLSEYMFGQTPLMEFEYVRRSIREYADIRLALTPNTKKVDPPSTDLLTTYKAKVRSDIKVLNRDDYKNASARSPMAFTTLSALPIFDMHTPLRIRIVGLDSISEESIPRLLAAHVINNNSTVGVSDLQSTTAQSSVTTPNAPSSTVPSAVTHLFLRVYLLHGLQPFPDSVIDTECVPLVTAPRFNKNTLIFTHFLLSSLPRSTRIAIVMYGRTDTNKELLLAYACPPLVTADGMFTSGIVEYKFWSVGRQKRKKRLLSDESELSALLRTAMTDNRSDRHVATVTLQFDSFALPIVYPLTLPAKPVARPPSLSQLPLSPPITLNKVQQKVLDELLAQDSLYRPSAAELAIVWAARHTLVKRPTALPIFLQSVAWHLTDHRNEAYALLKEWTPPLSPLSALELLDAKYADAIVREYAVGILRRFSDDQLAMYLLQLVQCLKFDLYHTSALSSFLLERARISPLQVGQPLFWHLKAEMHHPHTTERFTCIMEELLIFNPILASELRKQHSVITRLAKLSERVTRLKRDGYSDIDATREYHIELERINRELLIPIGSFRLPLNPKWQATTLIVEKCRYMSSKMVPLWIVFKNVDPNGPPILVMFKSGDDLRQDILCLQLLNVMDEMWLSQSIDLQIKAYRVIACGVNDNGEGIGLIEIVLNSETYSGIQLKHGGGAMGALKLDPIDLYIREHNIGSEQYNLAQQNWINSCTAYCVATYVLGIGDRHNGNIMVTKNGQLFHIDFGHFLGNFKTKYGVKRERERFVFTPEMAYVMGGKNYKTSKNYNTFINLCCSAYKSLRIQSHILLTLFLLMCSAGMPELSTQSDIYYVQNQLNLELNDKKADKKFKHEIDKSLQTTFRRVDNFFHNLKHG